MAHGRIEVRGVALIQVLLSWPPYRNVPVKMRQTDPLSPLVGQARLDGGIRVPGLAARSTGLAMFQRFVVDPQGQTAAPAQPGFIRRYDGVPTYQTIAAHGDGIDVVIPPPSTAVPSGELGLSTQHDRHLTMITEQGRPAWHVATDYGQRSLVETTMGRHKALIGLRLRAGGFATQQTEAAIGMAVLNRMLAAGRPKSVRRQPVIG